MIIINNILIIKVDKTKSKWDTFKLRVNEDRERYLLNVGKKNYKNLIEDVMQNKLKYIRNEVKRN